MKYRLPIPDSEIYYHHNFFSEKKSFEFLDRLVKKVSWDQHTIKIYGKEIVQPRLIAWIADTDICYTYSKNKLIPKPWFLELREIKREVENKLDCRFNSVLLNYYRDGQDSMSWHSDDEPELGKNPVVASVSFGSKRIFRFKHKFKKIKNYSIGLGSGSCLLMKGKTQHYWNHQLPKTKKEIAPRINLTFRYIFN